MKDYYKTLEVEREATKSDIKKAYFRLIRRYPPDRYPQEFMKIREAYEVLSDDSTRKQYDKVDDMPDVVKCYYNEAKNAFESADYGRAIKLMERVVKIYAEFSVVLGLLGDAYSANNNPVKAIRIYEEVVKKEPNNAGFAGKLALAYQRNGWHNKALVQFEKALKLDEDNISLWLGLVKCHLETKHFKLAKQVINKALEVSKKKGWENLELYYHIIQIDFFSGEIKQFEKHVEEMKIKAEKDDAEKSNVAWFFSELAQSINSFGMNAQAAFLIDRAHELVPDDEMIISIRDKIALDQKEHQSKERLGGDDSIDSLFDDMFELELGQCDCHSCKMTKFQMEMAVVMDIGSKRRDVQRIRKNYPDLYKLKEEFFNKVLDTKKEKSLVEQYIKQYKKYMKLYPDEFLPDDFEDDFEEEFDFFEKEQPMVREERKIGRNEPCPCGSGKKYKKCCGK